MLLSLLPVNILMCVWLFFFKCCGEANAAAAYGASEFEVVRFHGTYFFFPKKIGYSGKRGNNLPPWEAVRQEWMFPVPQAFVLVGYRSQV